MKKLYCEIIATLFVLTLFPACALGDQTFGRFTFAIYNGAAVITDFEGMEENLTIPDSHDGYPVTGIWREAFAQNYTLASIILPDGITSIGENAFYHCRSLTSFTFPEGLTSIGESAFLSCNSLTSVTFPEGLTTIGESAFCDCNSLTSVDFPKGLTTIGKSAFDNCDSLISITLPESLARIGYGAFASCGSLRFVTFAEGLEIIGVSAFENCALLEEIVIPSTVTSVGSRAFAGCAALRSVQMPVNVSLVGEAVFKGCSNLADIECYDMPVDADTLSPDHVWTNEALKIRLGMELSAFVPSQPEGNTCLLVIDNDSKVEYDNSIIYASTASDKQLQDLVKLVKDSIATTSGGKLSFTVNPEKASILLSLNVNYLYCGKFRVESLGAANSGYDCVVTLTATDMRTHIVMATETKNSSLESKVGSSYGWTEGDNGIWADFPSLNTRNIQTFTDEILEYLGEPD